MVQLTHAMSFTKKNLYERIRYSFPVQLLILHLKKNLLLLALWLVLFAIIFEWVAPRFGVHKQFLMPEYHGVSGFFSFFIAGFAVGGFFSAFHLYSYILHSYRFSFIHTLRHPFRVFAMNNAIIPLVYIVIFCWKAIHFAVHEEELPLMHACMNLFFWVSGITAFQLIVLSYFLVRSRNSKTHLTDFENHELKNLIEADKRLEKWRVSYYLSEKMHFVPARSTEHYSKERLEEALRKHQLNATRFEVFLLLSFIALGTFSHLPELALPSSASLMFLFTLALVFLAVLHHRLKGWSAALLLALLALMNFTYTKWNGLQLESRAFGLDYSNNITLDSLHMAAPTKDEIESSIHTWEGTLDKWLAARQAEGDSLPKLVILNVSGGGSRSAYWVMKSFLHADSLCQGDLFSHVVMMTGASGGMLGAAYLHELERSQALKPADTKTKSQFCDAISTDLLNPIFASFTMNDWFIRYKFAKEGNTAYVKDRGFAFERALASATSNTLDVRMRDYANDEREGKIPTLIFSPTIVNEGKRLIVSNMPTSFMCANTALIETSRSLPDNIEFTRLFKDNHPENTSLLSLLRMNATFPYILPMVTLPTTPVWYCMDAGLRDNFGTKTTTEFLAAMQPWIDQHTSGVVVISIHDLPKGSDLGDGTPTLVSELTMPLGSVYGNLTRTQDHNFDEALQYVANGYKRPIDVVSFELIQDKSWDVSLSWHLTKKEKRYINNALQFRETKEQMQRLQKLLTH